MIHHCTHWDDGAEVCCCCGQGWPQDSLAMWDEACPGVDDEYASPEEEVPEGWMS